MADTEQQLFLAEFIVDRAKLPSVRAVQPEIIPDAATCVSFEILDLPPINIHEEDTSENCNCPQGVVIFNKGKSCLFALPTMVVEKPLDSFPVTMSVYKKLPPGVLPDVMLIGTRRIETKELVNDLLSRRVFNDNNEPGNPWRSMKEAFKIKTATGQDVGEVTVFIRISWFGRKIVTQFQIPRPYNEKQSYLFKGSNDSPIFQFRRIPSSAERKREQVAPPARCICEANN